jgi:hypothetical protein
MIARPSRTPDFISPKADKRGPSSYWFNEMLMEPSPGSAIMKLGFCNKTGYVYFDWHSNPNFHEEIERLRFNRAVQNAWASYVDDLQMKHFSMWCSE